MTNDERMTKHECSIPATRPRDSVLDWGSALPLLLPRVGLKSGRGLEQSRRRRRASCTVESLDASFSAHCESGSTIFLRPAENDARTIAAFYFRHDSVFRHSDFLRHSTFIILSSFGRMSGDGLHDGRQINLVARQFAHLFPVAQHHDPVAVADNFLQLR